MLNSFVQGLAGIVMFATVLSAQQVISAVPRAGQHIAQSNATGLAKVVTLSVQNEMLESVLANIASQADLKAVFSSDVRNSSKQVTLRLTDVSAKAALDKALQGTGITYRLSSNGGIAFAASGRKRNGIAEGVILGKVTDSKTGKGVAGVTVSVGNNSRGVTTAEDGSYRLTGVAAGTHTITVRLVGYAKQTRSITIGEGAAVTADFSLELSANVLDQVVVTGTVVATELKAVPSAITVITAKQIEERGITRIDQLFRGDIPGLFAQNLGAGTVLDEVTMYSRGVISLTQTNPKTFETTKFTSPIKTYVDGVELANPKYLSQIDPKSIERIEIITGPQASTIYGSNAINGVMQIFTKRGTTSKPQVTLALLSGWIQNNLSSALTPQHDHSAQVNGVEGRLSYNAGGSWNHAGRWSPGKRTTRTNAFGGTRLELSTPAGRVTADMSIRRSNTKNTSRGSATQVTTNYEEAGWYNPAPFFGVGISIPNTTQANGQTLGLTLGYAPTSWWSHELLVGKDVLDHEVRDEDRGHRIISDTSLTLYQTHIDRRSLRYTTTAQAPVMSFARATVTLGADAEQNLNEQLIVSTSGQFTGTLSGFTSVTRRPGHNTGAFMQAQLGVLDRLFFTYGLRAEWNPTFGKDAMPNYAPRYGVAYTHELGMLTAKLRASYGRSTKPPEFGLKDALKITHPDVGMDFLVPFYGDIDYYVANPELAPEHQQGGEGGIELYFGTRGSLVVTRFNQTTDGLISGVFNVDSARSLEPNPIIFGMDCPTLIAVGFGFACSSQDADGYGYAPKHKYLNVGSIRNQGWELQGSVNTGPFTTRGTYSWTKSRTIGITPKYRSSFLPPEFYPQYQPGATFQYLPEHIWALATTYTNAKTTVGLNISGIGQLRNAIDDFRLRSLSSSIRLLQDRLNANSSVAYVSFNDGYAMADLNATHRFSSRVEGVLQVLNLGDYYKNDGRADHAIAGRQTKLGLRARF